MCDCSISALFEPSVGRIAVEPNRDDRVWATNVSGVGVGSIENNVEIPRANFTVGDGFGAVLDLDVDETWLYATTGSALWRIPKEGDYEEFFQGAPEIIRSESELIERLWLHDGVIYWMHQPFNGPFSLVSFDLGTLVETELAADIVPDDEFPDLTVGPDGLIWVSSGDFTVMTIQRFTLGGTLVDTFTVDHNHEFEVVVDLVPFAGSVYLLTSQFDVIRVETDLQQCIVDFPTWTSYVGVTTTPPPEWFTGQSSARGLGTNGFVLAASTGSDT